MNQIRREKIRKYIQEKGAVSVKEINSLFYIFKYSNLWRRKNKYSIINTLYFHNLIPRIYILIFILPVN